MSERAAASSTWTADESAAGLPPGSVLAQRYRIEALLGIGGMGMVYRATDLDLQVPVALKLLRPELSARPDAFERFRQEVLLARQVSSPQVLRIHDIARDGDRWFISMDWVEGNSLDRRLAEQGPLPIEDVVRIGSDLAAGLQAAHRQGVIHRDLKPSNVLLRADGQACIADFGIARSLRSSGLTRNGAVVGTPDYLSPEQAKGQPVDARSDLYALGLVLYEMLSARLPFAGETPAEQLSQRIGGYLTPINRWRPDTPPWLQRLVHRLLRAQPGQRLADAEAVLQALQTRQLPPDWQARRRAALGLLVLLAIGLGLWWGGQQPPTASTPAVQRWLVSAEADPATGLDADQLRALADWSRRWLADASGLAVADSERSESSLRRWRGDPTRAADRAALRRDLPHDHLLRLRWRGTPGALTVEAEAWAVDGGAPRRLRSEAPQPDPAAALAALQPAWADLLEVASWMDSPWAAAPAEQDLAPLGRALDLRHHGELQAAATALRGLGDPAAPSLLALAQALELALADGDRALATWAESALTPLLERYPHSRLQGLRLLAESNWPAALAWWSTRIQARGDDAEAAWRHAEAAIALGEFEAADATLRNALARDEGDPRGWLLRGKVAILRGDMRSAVDEYLVRAVLLSKRDRNRFVESEAVNALGVAYARLGQMNDAQEQYQRALTQRETIGHRRGVASTLRNLAQIALVQGRRDEAQQQLDRARGLFDALDDLAGLAAVDNELGVLAEEAGDYARALVAYRTALRSRETVGDRRGVAESQNNLGFVQYQLGDFDSARVFWLQAQESYRRLDDGAGEVRVGQNLGLLAMARGEWAESAVLLQQSLVDAERQQLSEEAAVSRRNLAELAWLRGDLIAAQEHLAAAAPLFAERADLRGSIDLALLRARIQLAAGRVAAASAELDGIAVALAETSPEQQALAALLRFDIAERRGSAADARQALVAARQPADAAGVRILHEAIALRRAAAAPELQARLQELGHRPLWLSWLERMLREAPRERAWAAYATSLDWLEQNADYVDGWRLHALAAGIAQQRGDAARAAAARLRARDALNRLRARTPAPWRDDLDRSARELLP